MTGDDTSPIGEGFAARFDLPRRESRLTADGIRSVLAGVLCEDRHRFSPTTTMAMYERVLAQVEREIAFWISDPFERPGVDTLENFLNKAHHFVNSAAGLQETRRVLSVGGRSIWFYEPTTPGWLQAAAERRVNRKRPEVPEHVIVPKAIAKLARTAQLQCTSQFCTSIAHRGRITTLHYIIFGAVPMLQRLLPCKANVTFRRVESGE